MPALIYDSGPYGLWYFVFLTMILGGAAAWVSGSAIAQTWRPVWQIPVYMLLLAGAVRFCHYALFGERLLSIRSYATDFVTLMLSASVGYWLSRRAQMMRQYGWSGREQK